MSNADTRKSITIYKEDVQPGLVFLLGSNTAVETGTYFRTIYRVFEKFDHKNFSDKDIALSVNTA